MKPRFARLAVVLAAALVLLGGVCARKLDPPEFVEVPNSVYAGDTAWVRLTASGRGYHSVRYVVNWDDASIETAELCALSDTAALWHVWTVAPDTKYVRAAVFAPEDTQGIRWAEQRMVLVDVGGSHSPVIDAVLTNQMVGVTGVPFVFTVLAHDPDGDSLRLEFQWSTTESTTVNAASPCSVTVNHVFAEVETAVVIISVQDTRGARSQPDTVFVPVGPAGGVAWYRLGQTTASPLVINGSVVGATLASHPAFCEQTQHIIVGRSEGGLSALNLNLSVAWRWPDTTESLGTWEWSAAAVVGDRIYAGCSDDSVYCLIDSVAKGVRVATFAPCGSLCDVPIVDAQGNVYFGTDSGYLYKVGPELDTLLWRTRLIARGEIYSPIVDYDGPVYCSSESARVYAIDPATGVPVWTITTDGRPLRLVMSLYAIFVGTSFGTAYSIDPATGSVDWQKSLSPGFGFETAPVVARGGVVYFQNDSDVLYCLSQADGSTIWSCDCPGYLPGTGGSTRRLRKTGLNDYSPNPTILFNGDIIVPGNDALYCVVGYTPWFSEPGAPWPKWQHDLYNSGCLGGDGRQLAIPLPHLDGRG